MIDRNHEMERHHDVFALSTLYFIVLHVYGTRQINLFVLL